MSPGAGGSAPAGGPPHGVGLLVPCGRARRAGAGALPPQAYRNSGRPRNYTTTLSYTAAGHLTSSSIGDGRPRTVTFTTDMSGQVIRRDEADNNSSGGDPHEIWYRYGGRQLGYTGNNGTLETDYLTSIDNRTRTPPSNPAAFMRLSGSVRRRGSRGAGPDHVSGQCNHGYASPIDLCPSRAGYFRRP